MENHAIGTVNALVPVFKFRGVPSIKYGGFTYEVTGEQYQYNVTQYLTYMMPKDEFKKRWKVGND